MIAREPQLLSDEQMKAFIVDGVLLLKTDFSPEFHARLLEKLDTVHEEEGNPGNNILPRIRELRKVFEHPVITGALTSVLGPNYLMHTHRHCHHNAMPKAGGWHKDSYWGYDRIRNHHPWWAMIMYFPQDTPIELGPTGVVPGSQNYESRTFEQDDPAEEVTANGEAGTFVLIHYDIWHRSTRNRLGKPRYMLKFEFMRTVAPESPSWDNRSGEWSVPESALAMGTPHPELWQDTWNWLRGEIGGRYGMNRVSEQEVARLAGDLSSNDERAALEAAYRLAAAGDTGRDALLEVLQASNERASLRAAYGLTACGAAAVNGLTLALDSAASEPIVNHAAFALGELRYYAAGSAAKLVSLFASQTPRVRRTIADSLGMIGRAAKESTVSGLIDALKDEDAAVRFTAGLSLVKLGSAAEEAIPHLAEALEDNNRYVQGHAVEALRYIDTEQSREVLLQELIQSRWCPSTTKASTF
ncbi:HEAT repeat domain-containing protein [Cohnella herbarum]|uniref:Phytanoyl-CoA dioxygenase n=1 Tax=Cohnella herbarum TaxID=2728023 RepID=A0A7Z2VFG6_9BACL|nr:HEAT repeat domain-containing protein [Cohnella herbarum]QJD82081.1 phytanoyl-CoA dioxygenase [Cohnella herbarum]